MRKHSAKCAQKWGSTRIDSASPQLAHKVVNSKSFQFNANYLLMSLLSRYMPKQKKINLNLDESAHALV